ncbi:MAG: myo-inositol 2-dehydrogenase/D-chiro-inositol 1-dehydrogenase [Candidatus Binatia bacterium]|jgi:myo-inositol 2-dehydrogenase/D-chiro-inositol 1-dehydrogenase
MSESNSNAPKSPINRRNFLQRSSTLAAGGMALTGLGVDKFVHAASSDTIKLALVGCGGRGSGAVDQALTTNRLGNGSVKLVAMADAYEDKLLNSLSSIRKKHHDHVDVPPDRQFVGVDAYKKAIAEADVVVLATPPGFRPVHFEEAVKQGKNVFFEKPVAVDAPGIRKVLAAAHEAKKKNLKIGVGLQRHHQTGYIETMKRLHDGAIGDIVSARCYWNGTPVGHKGTRQGLTNQWGRKPSELEYQMRNWYQFVWLCGDHIVEQHIHNIDVINWVKGTHPISAQGMGGREVRKGIDDGEIFDHHFVEFEYEDGSRCYSQCRHQKGCFNSISEHVVGTKGSVDINPYQKQYHINSQGGKWRHRPANGRVDANPYQQEHDDLFEAIRKDKPYNEAEYGALSTMTAIFGRMCTYTGKKITWDQAINSPISTMPDDLAYDEANRRWTGTPKSQPDANGQYPIPVPGDPEWFKKIVG